jgi:hypothetical protein
MRSSIISAAALLAACVSAIKITSPSKNDVVDLAAGVKVTWDTVSSDPKTAHLFLVNQAGGHTQYSKDLGEIDLSAGSQKVTVADVPNDTSYQFNVQSVTQLNTGILAQSEQFEVKADKASAQTTSKTSASSTTSTTDAPTGATDSVSSTLSSVFSSMTTVAPSPSGANNGTRPSTTSTSTAGAATGAAVQGGSLLALAIGLVAIIA